MEKTSTSASANWQKHSFWWLQILLGILFTGCAVWFWLTPLETYLTLALFFSYAMFITGIFEIANALSVRKVQARWGIYLAGGIIDLVLGVILITHEGLTLEVLPLLLGIWFIFRSFAFFVTYGDVRKDEIPNSGWILAAAIMTMLFGFAILARPVIGQLTLVYTVSFAFFFMGLYRIALGTGLMKKM